MTITISTAELRRGLADALNRASYAKNRIVVERNGQPVAAIVPMDDLRALQALEDTADALAADAAKAEGGSITLDHFVKALQAAARPSSTD